MPRPLLSRAAAAATAAVAAAAWAGPVQADVFAHASLTRFGYRLIDLNPADGIAPALRFKLLPGLVDGGTTLSASASEATLPQATGASDTATDGFRQFRPMDFGVDIPGVRAAAALSGSVQRHDLAARGSGWLRNGPGTPHTRSFTSVVFPAYSANSVFEVTPFTRVVFAGQLSLRVRTTARFPESFEEVAAASVSTIISTSPSQVRSETLQVEANLESGVSADQRSGWQRYVYANPGAAWDTGRFDLRLQVQGQSVIRLGTAALPSSPAPVPEPATAALLLCGLGLLAGVTRRERRRGAHG